MAESTPKPEMRASSSPAIIILGDSIYGETPEKVAARPGWEVLSAVRDGSIFSFNDDLVSLPGPRMVDGLEELARLLQNGGITVLVIFLIVSGWTYYNYLWFLRRGERRGGQVKISSDVEMSGMLGTDSTAMEEIRKSRRLEVRVDGPLYRITARE